MARTELDLDHVTAVCDRLTQTRVAAGLNITPTRRGYAITATANAGARRVEAAFTRLGYRASVPERFGRRDQVAVTGWSQPRLEARIAALYEAVSWLQDSRDRTAAAAIENGMHSRGDLHDSLRATIERETGVITDRAPAVRLDDHDCARLLQTAYQLEHEAAAHIRRHVQAAETALDLYRQYRPGMPEDQARGLAVTTACTHGPPPSWANGPDQDSPMSATPTAADATSSEAGKRQDVQAHAAEAIETPAERPVEIAAHDQPGDAYVDGGGAYVEIVADDTPPPPAISPNHSGPARGPTTH